MRTRTAFRSTILLSTIALLALGQETQTFVDDPEKRLFASGDTHVRSHLVQCYCSPSGRGAAKSVIAEVKASLEPFNKKLKSIGGIQGLRTDEDSKQASAIGRALIKRFGYEAVVNADASLRDSSSAVFCSFVSDSGKNVRESIDVPGTTVTVGRCNTDQKTTYKPEFLGGAASDGATPPAKTGDSTSPPATRTPSARKSTSPDVRFESSSTGSRPATSAAGNSDSAKTK